MAIAYLMLGSNIGEKRKNLEKAADALAKAGNRILVRSPIYESEPWGFQHSEYFYNQLIILQTEFPPKILLLKILEIEENMGRIRNSKEYEARIIDIDIIYYDKLVLNTESLVIPHPRMAERRFVLKPLLDLAPDLVHPVNGKTTWEMYRECEDELSIKKIDLILN